QDRMWKRVMNPLPTNPTPRRFAITASGGMLWARIASGKPGVKGRRGLHARPRAGAPATIDPPENAPDLPEPSRSPRRGRVPQLRLRHLRGMLDAGGRHPALPDVPRERRQGDAPRMEERPRRPPRPAARSPRVGCDRARALQLRFTPRPRRRVGAEALEGPSPWRQRPPRGSRTRPSSRPRATFS